LQKPIYGRNYIKSVVTNFLVFQFPTSTYFNVNLCCESIVLHLVFEAAYSGDDNGY